MLLSGLSGWASRAPLIPDALRVDALNVECVATAVPRLSTEDVAPPREQLAGPNTAADGEALTLAPASAGGGVSDIVGNVPFIAQTVNFVVLGWLLWRFVGRKLVAHQLQRHESLNREIAKASESRRAAEAAYEAMRLKVAGLEAESLKVIEESVARAQDEAARLLEDAERRSLELLRQAERRAQQTRIRLKRELAESIVAQTMAKLEQRLSGELGAEAQQRYWEQSIAQLSQSDSLSGLEGSASGASSTLGGAS